MSILIVKSKFAGGGGNTLLSSPPPGQDHQTMGLSLGKEVGKGLMQPCQISIHHRDHTHAYPCTKEPLTRECNLWTFITWNRRHLITEGVHILNAMLLKINQLPYNHSVPEGLTVSESSKWWGFRYFNWNTRFQRYWPVPVDAKLSYNYTSIIIDLPRSCRIRLLSSVVTCLEW